MYWCCKIFVFKTDVVLLCFRRDSQLRESQFFVMSAAIELSILLVDLLIYKQSISLLGHCLCQMTDDRCQLAHLPSLCLFSNVSFQGRAVRPVRKSRPTPAPSAPPFSLPLEVDCCINEVHYVGMVPGPCWPRQGNDGWILSRCPPSRSFGVRAGQEHGSKEKWEDRDHSDPSSPSR